MSDATESETTETTTETEQYESPVITKHQITVRGKNVQYTTTTGMMKLESDEGKHRANIFYVAYTKDTANERTRP
ncbi:MAG: hypothetical protein JNJ85_02195, partial [Candidatus Kapabacteria bacterium]|nr:hypothetical protein [Candidatus Kapabacteria bacterium]